MARAKDPAFAKRRLMGSSPAARRSREGAAARAWVIEEAENSGQNMGPFLAGGSCGNQYNV